MRIGFFYDFDLTLTEEPQQYPIFRFFMDRIKRTYGFDKPERYWKECGEGDMSVGWMQQFIEDASPRGSRVFYRLTNERMEKEFAPQIKLSPGLPEWFPRINRFCEELGLEPTHHVISAGVKPLIEGTKISKYLENNESGEFEEDKKGINNIKKAVEPFRKVEFIKRICKGTDLDKDIPLEEYYINYSNAFVFADGQTDKSMCRHIKERGGDSIIVYEKENIVAFDKAVSGLGHSANFIVPRDYSEGSILEQSVQESLRNRINNPCNMDFDLVHKMLRKQIKNSQIRKIIEKHYQECGRCKKRSSPDFKFS